MHHSGAIFIVYDAIYDGISPTYITKCVEATWFYANSATQAGFKHVQSPQTNKDTKIADRIHITDHGAAN